MLDDITSIKVIPVHPKVVYTFEVFNCPTHDEQKGVVYVATHRCI